MPSLDGPPPAAIPAPVIRDRLDGPLFWMAVAGLLTLYLLLALYHLSGVPLIDPDEPRYAEASRTMYRGGSWLIPEFNQQPRINKPPMFYWLVALGSKACGTFSEATARLPSVALGLAMLLFTVYLGCRIYCRTAGLTAGLILLTMPIFLALSRACITDMTFAAFLAGSIGFLLLGMAEALPMRRALLTSTLLLGLAALTKATPALAMVAVVIVDRALALSPNLRPAAARWLPALLLAGVVLSGAAIGFQQKARVIKIAALQKQNQGDRRRAEEMDADAESSEFPGGPAEERFRHLDTWSNYASLLASAGAVTVIVWMAARSGLGALSGTPWLAGLLLALSMGLWWYAAVVLQLGWDSFQALLRTEIGGRMTGQMHREPMYYYLPVLAGVIFPWSVGLPGAIGCAWPRHGGEPSRQQTADRFVLAWLLAIVLFFSIPGAKLSTYLLPAMPAAALLVARFLSRLNATKDPIPAGWKKLTLALAGLMLVALTVVAINPGLVDAEHRDLLEQLHLPLWALAVIYGLALGGGWLAALRGRAASAALILAGTSAASVLLILPAALPRLERRSTRELCARIHSRISDCERVVSMGAEIESLSYYLDRFVDEARRRRVVQRRAGSRAARNEDLAPVSEDEPMDAVLIEELARPQKVALFIQRRYYARMRDIKIDKMNEGELARTAPDGAEYVGRNDDIIVIRNNR